MNFWKILSEIFFDAAALAVVVPVLYAIYDRRRTLKISSFKEELDDERDLVSIRADLDGGHPIALSRTQLDNTNLKIGEWFGPSLSTEAYNKCLQLAFLYPFALFIGSWVLGGSANIAGEDILHSHTSAWVRFGGAVTFAIVFGITWFALSRFQAVRRLVDKVVPGCLQRLQFGASIGTVAAVVVSSATTFAAVYIALATTLSFTGNSTAALAIIVAASAAALGAGIRSVAFAVSFATVVAVYEIALSPSASIVATATIVLFFAALPMVCAFLDWASWASTRLFLTRLRSLGHRASALGFLALHLILDFGVTLILLVFAAILMPNLVELMNWLLGLLGAARTDWMMYVDHAVVDGLAGMLVWGMLLSSLIPTAFHFLVGMRVLFGALSRTEEIIDLWPKDGRGWSSTGSRNRAATLLADRDVWWMFGALLVIGISGLFTSGIFLWHESLGSALHTIATCSTAWNHGICTP